MKGSKKSLSLRKLMNWLRRISTSFLFLVAGKTGFAKLPRNKKHVHRTVHLFTTAPRERKGSAQPIPLAVPALVLTVSLREQRDLHRFMFCLHIGSFRNE